MGLCLQRGHLSCARLMLALGLLVGALGMSAAHAQSLSTVPAGQPPARASHLQPVQQASRLNRAATHSSLQAAPAPATKLEQVQQLRDRKSVVWERV